MHRRSLLAACGTAAFAGLAGCLGDDDEPEDDSTTPSDDEFSIIQEFASDAIFALEYSELVFAALVDDEAGRDDVELALDDLQVALDATDNLPDRSVIEDWEFTLESDGTEWDVDGDELADVVAELVAVTESTHGVVEDVLDVMDDGEIGEGLADRMGETIEDINDIVPQARSVIFND